MNKYLFINENNEIVGSFTTSLSREITADEIYPQKGYTAIKTNNDDIINNYNRYVFDGTNFILKTEEEIVDNEKINQQVIAKIRQLYSINDEFQMQRLGLDDSRNTEYQEYLIYVNECVEWGRLEKEKHGLI